MKLRVGRLILCHRALTVGALLALFASITVAVTQFGAVNRMDAKANAEAHERMSHESAGWADHLASLASTQTALLVTIIGALCLLATRHFRGAIALGLAYGVTQGVVHLVKEIVSRPRPDQAFEAAQGFSFPSAHSATSVAVYATIAFILIRASRNGQSRVAIAAFAGALVIAVGFSRVLLGAHYPTDVLAGWTFGALLASLCWLVATKVPVPRLSFSAAR